MGLFVFSQGALTLQGLFPNPSGQSFNTYLILHIKSLVKIRRNPLLRFFPMICKYNLVIEESKRSKCSFRTVVIIFVNITCLAAGRLHFHYFLGVLFLEKRTSLIKFKTYLVWLNNFKYNLL